MNLIKPFTDAIKSGITKYQSREINWLADSGHFDPAIKLLDQGKGSPNVWTTHTVTCWTGTHPETMNIGFKAVIKDNDRALDDLLERGLNPNLTDPGNREPLILLAATHGTSHAVETLLDAGAKTLGVKNQQLKTIEEILRERKGPEFTRLADRVAHALSWHPHLP